MKEKNDQERKTFVERLREGMNPEGFTENPVNKQIENNFTYHAPTEGKILKYADVRGVAKSLAYLIEEHVPESREQSLAMTKLEEAVMWANAGIARY